MTAGKYLINVFDIWERQWTELNATRRQSSYTANSLRVHGAAVPDLNQVDDFIPTLGNSRELGGVQLWAGGSPRQLWAALLHPLAFSSLLRA